MIWNSHNIIRNFIFLFFIFIFYCFFFITDANSQTDLRICDSSNKGWSSTNQNDYPNDFCTTKCSDLKVDETGYSRGALGNNNYGKCAGSATSSALTIYRIDLGTSSGFGGSDKCTVFEGNITTDFAKLNKGQTAGKGTFKTDSCQKGKSYDRLYFYFNRMQSFAGQTVFPDGSGTIARTTSACANNDTTATVSDTSWLDTTTNVTYKWNDNTKCWGKPNGWTTSAYIKADKTNLLTSISDLNNALVTYDDFKVFYILDTTIDSDGFRREFGSDGETFGVKVDPTDANKNIYVIKNGSSLITGLPIVFDNTKKKLNLEISYYSSKRDNDTTIGVTFLFRRNGTNAELVGFLSGENGMFFTLSYN